jgi:hypothetical protein
MSERSERIAEHSALVPHAAGERLGPCERLQQDSEEYGEPGA